MGADFCWYAKLKLDVPQGHLDSVNGLNLTSDYAVQFGGVNAA
jgi:hypothetical protein